MAPPVPPLHCVPDRKLTQPELERSNACLGSVVVDRDRTIVGLQDYARDVSRAPGSKPARVPDTNPKRGNEPVS